MNLFCMAFFMLLACLTGCHHPPKPTLKVAATSIPHAEILEFVQAQLQQQNVDLEIILADDFNTPNRALADGEVDANFFQHTPFLEAQKAHFGYALEILTAVHVEPMGLYSKRYTTWHELQQPRLIALPSDPTNLGRALTLLAQIGLISLKSLGFNANLLDITHNPYHLRFIEMDAPLLARALDDVDAAAITTNFALLSGLSPQSDALALENDPLEFANLVVIRSGESGRSDLQALRKALTSEEVRQFIREKYQGAIIPAF